jgi:hypothetical protein
VLDTLITNKTRIKLLLRFFLNAESSAYLRGLEEEFDESTNAIRVELNRFEAAGLLTSGMERNKKVFRANRQHPLYHDINVILRKHIGLDRIVEQIVNKLGNVTRAYVAGDLAMGLDTKKIELILVASTINREYLDKCIAKAESLIQRQISSIVLKEAEETKYLRDNPKFLLIWEK